MKCPHCDIHIDEHEATRCLDAWVAEVVMEFDLGGPSNDALMLEAAKYYSTDIAAAWEVWKKLGDDNWIVSVAWGNGRDGRKYASVQMSIDLFLKADLLSRPITQMDAKAPTIPLALCRAAIKATLND